MDFYSGIDGQLLNLTMQCCAEGVVFGVGFKQEGLIPKVHVPNFGVPYMSTKRLRGAVIFLPNIN